MNKGPRVLVALGIGFVLYRICVEFMNHGSAILIGVIACACAAALIPAARPLVEDDEPGEDTDD